MAKKKIKSKSKISNCTKAVSSPDFDAITTEAITSALSSVNQSILKVCRLCESKDGPFHNIFDSEKITAKKIEELMPFWVAENDDLPHKICFRCSAKVEELYEFVQKCVGTQVSLRKTIGNTEPLPMKKKTRALWEQSLNKSNMSNDDICHALIKKAMEGIKDIVKPSNDIEENSKIELKPTTEKQEETDGDEVDDEKVNEEKNSKNIDRINVRPLRSNKILQSHPVQSVTQPSQIKNVASKEQLNLKNNTVKHLTVDLTDKGKDIDTSSKCSEDSKPFDIMDHVTMIKVNGVGVLFQCKLCNRNFLKKEVVLSHGCAKTGVPKIDKCNMYVPPEPPKPSTVKYINTRINTENKTQPVAEIKPAIENENSQTSIPKQNVRRKIGPASKTGRRSENSIVRETESSDESNKSIPNQTQPSPSSAAPLNLLAVPNLSSRYKIVPGPNNTFTLVEEKEETDTSTVTNNSETDSIIKNRKIGSPVIIDLEKSTDDSTQNVIKHSKKSNPSRAMPKSLIKNMESRTEPSSASQPYPVGLFQTNPQAAFTTPAMKKQSYTVVQTGNPNKLLISTKPQDSIESSKKRLKKTKTGPASENKEEPFSVILEDATHPKDTSFFTFINVDPLLQPSYVLPTDSIIQESQITTSTQIARSQNDIGEKDKYSCNICGDSFNREKKLSAHINAHYNVDNDYVDDGPPKKRGKK